MRENTRLTNSAKGASVILKITDTETSIPYNTMRGVCVCVCVCVYVCVHECMREYVHA